MIPARHRLGSETLRAVASGDATPDEILQVVGARRSRNLLMLAALVRLSALSEHPAAPVTATAFQHLARIERLAPGAVRALVHHPPVAAWAFRAVRDLQAGRSRDADPSHLANVAASAAVLARTELAETWELPLGQPVERAGGRHLFLPGLGRVAATARDRSLLRVSPAGAELVTGGTAVSIPDEPHRRSGAWEGVNRLTTVHHRRELTLLLDTGTPSDKAGEPTFAHDEPYSTSAATEWRRSLDEAWRLLVERHPSVAGEVSSMVTVLMPLVSPRRGWASATPNDAFGAIALSLPPDPDTFALILAHEVQHVKLTAVGDLFPLIEDDNGETFYAPWRSDPRPAFGLLHGVYAHLGVSAFWHRQLMHLSGSAARAAEIEFDRWRTAARQTGETVARSVRLTPAGRVFVEAMLDAIKKLCSVPVSARAHAAATRQSRLHFQKWLASNAPG